MGNRSFHSALLSVFSWGILLFTVNAFALSDEIKTVSDVSYGNDKEQAIDVYYPAVKRKDAPVIFMVHGGAWIIGDKDSRAVVRNKVAHWVPKGFIFISVNYRMLPDLHPVEQAADVKKALLYAQQNIGNWGGSADKFILMGHSAGAHLVSLISVTEYSDIKPWLGTIALDSAAYNIEKIMNAQSPPRLYKKAFGETPAYWRDASPFYRLTKTIPPFFAICSSERRDDPCTQAKSFIDKAKELGTQAQLLALPFSHREINTELGKDYCYTQAVDNFIKKLNLSVEAMLLDRSSNTNSSSMDSGNQPKGKVSALCNEGIHGK